MMPVWLHIDINSYFATMLQQENPALRGRPVGVTKGHGRTCVIAASKEAKALGVRTGDRTPEALELAPHLILVPANFPLYTDATKRLRKLFQQVAPHVEIFSLDEAFIDISDCRRLYPDPVKLGQEIQERIKTELGAWVTCNIGVARNRLMSKMASEVSPKGTVTLVDERNWDHLLATSPFRSVCGIGYRLEKRLRKMGVAYPYQINFLTDEDLLLQFGEFWTEQLRRIGRGEEPYLLAGREEEKPLQSVSRSITGFGMTKDPEKIRRILYNLAEEVMRKARRLSRAGRHVSLYLSDKHDRRWGAQRTLRTPIRHTSEFFQILGEELEQFWVHPFPVIKYAVRLGMLQSWQYLNDEIFPTWQKQEQLEQAVDQVSNRYGLYTLRPALLTDAKSLIFPEVTGYLGDKEYIFREE